MKNMDIKRAISIINGDIIANTEEPLDAYKTFFSSLGVDIQNTDKTYKTTCAIFREAHAKLNKGDDE